MMNYCCSFLYFICFFGFVYLIHHSTHTHTHKRAWPPSSSRNCFFYRHFIQNMMKMKKGEANFPRSMNDGNRCFSCVTYASTGILPPPQFTESLECLHNLKWKLEGGKNGEKYPLFFFLQFHPFIIKYRNDWKCRRFLHTVQNLSVSFHNCKFSACLFVHTICVTDIDAF